MISIRIRSVGPVASDHLDDENRVDSRDDETQGRFSGDLFYNVIV